MFQPTHRSPQHGLRQHPAQGMNSFMFGNPQPPIQRNTFTKQQLNPINLLNSPQINKGISGFSGILDNVQHVLRIVETTTPLIREYGPMIKNLPAMYRMVKAFKDIDNEPELKDDDRSIDTKQSMQSETEREETETQSHRKSNGLSTPKLYI